MHKLFYIFIVLFSLACNNKKTTSEVSKDDILLAKVNDEMLYFSEVPAFQIKNLESKDSVSFLKNFVENWIKEETMVQKAKETLTNFSAINSKARQFKNDLIRSSYEKKVLESLEIELTQTDLENYYNTHKEYFVFDEDFYEMQYILLPKNTSGIQQIRKNIRENKPSAFVESYCQNNPEKCHLKESILKNENYVKNTLHLSGNYLQNSADFKYFYSDQNTILIYKVLSKKNKGDIAPLEIIEKELSTLALENKKQEFLQNLEEKTYQKAKNDKIFENYIN